MTRYTVVWHRRAQDLLAEIWLQSSDRRSIAAASDAIDRELAIDPDEKGVPAIGRIRKLVIPPLNCLFDIIEEDRIAHVVLVRRTSASRSAGSAGDRENGGSRN